jgi:hypothetical protein
MTKPLPRASVPFSEPADQLGCVVPDLGAAISEWVAKGVGPFLTLPGLMLDCPIGPNRRSGSITPPQGQTHGLRDKTVEHVFRLHGGKVTRFDIN